MQTAKISRFPSPIREELNRRLDRSEPQERILAWVNSLPEVQVVLNAEFKSKPVTKQNLSDWKNTSFHNWQLAQTALQFVNDSAPAELEPAALQQMSARLTRFLQIRYAALASKLPAPAEDPAAELRLLADLCNNFTALRRGDHSAERLGIEHERLALEKSRTTAEQERLFREWTTRPDIQEKLYPSRDPDQIHRDVDRLITERMLGIRRDPAPALPPDPACLI